MAGKHRARGYMRKAGTAVLALAAAATTFVIAESGASAADYGAGCSAAAVNFNAPTPVRLAWANPQYSPCVTDTKSLLSASATLIPAPLGIGATKTTVSGVTSKTFQGWTPYGYAIKASSDIAKITVSGPGINLVASGVHSDATVYEGDGYYTSVNSWITTLTINGVRVNVAKNTPLTIPLGLRISINVNYQSNWYSGAEATPLLVTFSDYRYNLSVADSEVNVFPLD